MITERRWGIIRQLTWLSSLDCNLNTTYWGTPEKKSTVRATTFKISSRKGWKRAKFGTNLTQLPLTPQKDIPPLVWPGAALWLGAHQSCHIGRTQSHGRTRGRRRRGQRSSWRSQTHQSCHWPLPVVGNSSTCHLGISVGGNCSLSVERKYIRAATRQWQNLMNFMKLGKFWSSEKKK